MLLQKLNEYRSEANLKIPYFLEKLGGNRKRKLLETENLNDHKFLLVIMGTGANLCNKQTEFERSNLRNYLKKVINKKELIIIIILQEIENWYFRKILKKWNKINKIKKLTHKNIFVGYVIVLNQRKNKIKKIKNLNKMNKSIIKKLKILENHNFLKIKNNIKIQGLA